MENDHLECKNIEKEQPKYTEVNDDEQTQNGKTPATSTSGNYYYRLAMNKARTLRKKASKCNRWMSKKVFPKLNKLKQSKATEFKEVSILKLRQTNESQRRFWTGNTASFAMMSAGAIITLISLPAMAVGVGAPMLPLGVGLLIFGSGATAVGNNIWPNKFKPRNGDIVDDNTNILKMNAANYLEQIGLKREMKRVLKANKNRVRQEEKFIKDLSKVKDS